MPKTLLPLALLSLLCLAPALRADDETPAQRTKRVSAAFPEPSKDMAFATEMDMVMGAAAIGTIKFAAAVEDGHWKFEEAGKMPGHTMQATGLAGKDLVSLGGESAETDPDGAEHSTWERTEDGYTIETAKGEAEPTEQEIKAADGAYWSFASLVLFCRMVPADKVEYAMAVLNPSPSGDSKVLEDGRLRVEGPGKWESQGKSVDAFICVATKADGTMTMAFDPARKALLGMKMQKGGMSIDLVPKGQMKEAPKVDWSKPATSAQLAAARAGLAMTIADAEILGDVTHWPSIIAQVKKAKNLTDDLPEDEFRAGVMASLVKKGEREVIEPLVAAAMEGMTLETTPEGDTKVQFPAPMNTLILYVREFDGVWKLVKFPGV